MLRGFQEEIARLRQELESAGGVPGRLGGEEDAPPGLHPEQLAQIEAELQAEMLQQLGGADAELDDQLLAQVWPPLSPLAERSYVCKRLCSLYKIGENAVGNEHVGDRRT